MKSNYKKLGEYIQEINKRNSDLAVTKLIGVSMEKTFIPSVANVVGTDMSVYKILKKGQLACKLMSVGRDEKLPVDLYTDNEDAIVSSAYYVFEPKNKEELLPEYLMMWLCRPENDRYIGFVSGGDVRGGISWDTFCNLPIKVPSSSKQKEIVKEYNVIQNRINLNQKLIQKLEECALAIYQQWFVDFEFPDECGIPYKSSGGKMVFNEKFEKNVPKDWVVKRVKDFSVDMKSGGTPDRGIKEYWDSFDIPWLKTGELKNSVILESEEYISKLGLAESAAKILPVNSILIAMYGEGNTKGQVGYLKIPSAINQACCAMICENEEKATFLYYHLRINRDYIVSVANGGAQPNLSKNIIEEIEIVEPTSSILKKHPFVKIMNLKEKYLHENRLLGRTSDLLLSKLTTIGN